MLPLTVKEPFTVSVIVPRVPNSTEAQEMVVVEDTVGGLVKVDDTPICTASVDVGTEWVKPKKPVLQLAGVFQSLPADPFQVKVPAMQ